MEHIIEVCKLDYTPRDEFDLATWLKTVKFIEINMKYFLYFEFHIIEKPVKNGIITSCRVLVLVVHVHLFNGSLLNLVQHETEQAFHSKMY